MGLSAVGPAGGRGRGSHPDNSRFVVNISGGGGGVRCRQYRVSQNKHCEILVSYSDKEWNCMQAHETACKLMDLHALWNTPEHSA